MKNESDKQTTENPPLDAANSSSTLIHFDSRDALLEALCYRQFGAWPIYDCDQEPLDVWYANLPWWRKDKYGFPIETFKGEPVKSAMRIICQNIRKVIFKTNVKCSPTSRQVRRTQAAG